MVLQRIDPQSVDHRLSRVGPAATRGSHMAADAGVGEQLQHRGNVAGFEVGQLCPKAGPHTVVCAAGR
ncbi:MAG: hypothetical protein QOC62_4804 [Mycobacterium sp.]|nr:hypothetical protein [Mycobacterium sp.]